MFKLNRNRDKPAGFMTYVADFVIVILGVFLGLQAQTWADNRSDRARAAHFVDRVGADFTAILDDIRICVAISEKSADAIERVRSALEKIDGQGSSAIPQGLDDSLVAMTAGIMPPGRSSAYVEMVSAGDLGLLKSQSLRDALIQYDQEALTNRDTWLLLRESLAPVMPFVYRHVLLKQGSTLGQAAIGSYDAQKMANDPDVSVALSTMAAVAANSYALCKAQEKSARAVVRNLSG